MDRKTNSKSRQSLSTRSDAPSDSSRSSLAPSEDNSTKATNMQNKKTIIEVTQDKQPIRILTPLIPIPQSSAYPPNHRLSALLDATNSTQGRPRRFIGDLSHPQGRGDDDGNDNNDGDDNDGEEDGRVKNNDDSDDNDDNDDDSDDGNNRGGHQAMNTSAQSSKSTQISKSLRPIPSFVTVSTQHDTTVLSAPEIDKKHSNYDTSALFQPHRPFRHQQRASSGGFGIASIDSLDYRTTSILSRKPPMGQSIFGQAMIAHHHNKYKPSQSQAQQLPSSQTGMTIKTKSDIPDKAVEGIGEIRENECRLVENMADVNRGKKMMSPSDFDRHQSTPVSIHTLIQPWHDDNDKELSALRTGDRMNLSSSPGSASSSSPGSALWSSPSSSPSLDEQFPTQNQSKVNIQHRDRRGGRTHSSQKRKLTKNQALLLGRSSDYQPSLHRKKSKGIITANGDDEMTMIAKQSKSPPNQNSRLLSQDTAVDDHMREHYYYDGDQGKQFAPFLPVPIPTQAKVTNDGYINHNPFLLPDPHDVSTNNIITGPRSARRSRYRGHLQEPPLSRPVLLYPPRPLVEKLSPKSLATLGDITPLRSYKGHHSYMNLNHNHYTNTAFIQLNDDIDAVLKHNIMVERELNNIQNQKLSPLRDNHDTHIDNKKSDSIFRNDADSDNNQSLLNTLPHPQALLVHEANDDVLSYETPSKVRNSLHLTTGDRTFDRYNELLPRYRRAKLQSKEKLDTSRSNIQNKVITSTTNQGLGLIKQFANVINVITANNDQEQNIDISPKPRPPSQSTADNTSPRHDKISRKEIKQKDIPITVINSNRYQQLLSGKNHNDLSVDDSDFNNFNEDLNFLNNQGVDDHGTCDSTHQHHHRQDGDSEDTDPANFTTPLKTTTQQQQHPRPNTYSVEQDDDQNGLESFDHLFTNLTLISAHDWISRSHSSSNLTHPNSTLGDPPQGLTNTNSDDTEYHIPNENKYSQEIEFNLISPIFRRIPFTTDRPINLNHATLINYVNSDENQRFIEGLDQFPPLKPVEHVIYRDYDPNTYDYENKPPIPSRNDHLLDQSHGGYDDEDNYEHNNIPSHYHPTPNSNQHHDKLFFPHSILKNDSTFLYSQQNQSASPSLWNSISNPSIRLNSQNSTILGPSDPKHSSASSVSNLSHPIKRKRVSYDDGYTLSSLDNSPVNSVSTTDPIDSIPVRLGPNGSFSQKAFPSSQTRHSQNDILRVSSNSSLSSSPRPLYHPHYVNRGNDELIEKRQRGLNSISWIAEDDDDQGSHFNHPVPPKSHSQPINSTMGIPFDPNQTTTPQNQTTFNVHHSSQSNPTSDHQPNQSQPSSQRPHEHQGDQQSPMTPRALSNTIGAKFLCSCCSKPYYHSPPAKESFMLCKRCATTNTTQSHHPSKISSTWNEMTSGLTGLNNTTMPPQQPISIGPLIHQYLGSGPTQQSLNTPQFQHDRMERSPPFGGFNNTNTSSSTLSAALDNSDHGSKKQSDYPMPHNWTQTPTRALNQPHHESNVPPRHMNSHPKRNNSI